MDYDTERVVSERGNLSYLTLFCLRKSFISWVRVKITTIVFFCIRGRIDVLLVRKRCCPIVKRITNICTRDVDLAVPYLG